MDGDMMDVDEVQARGSDGNRSRDLIGSKDGSGLFDGLGGGAGMFSSSVVGGMDLPIENFDLGLDLGIGDELP